MYAYKNIRVHINTDIYIYMYVCMYVCMYVHFYGVYIGVKSTLTQGMHSFEAGFRGFEGGTM